MDKKKLINARRISKFTLKYKKKLKKSEGKNKIVDGVYHSRKNGIHRKKQLKDMEVTPKGVPLVAVKDCEDDTCAIDQVAEVEKNELILTKEVTDTVLAMKTAYQKHKLNTVLVQLGKYLKEQILNNTEDSKDKLLK